MIQNIIDTHVHIWDLKRVEYSWLKGDSSILNKTHLLNELTPQIMQVNVSKGILVQAANNMEDTSLMLEEASNNEWIKGVVGWLPLTDPAATADLLETMYAGNPYLKGVRHLIHTELDHEWLLQDTVIESLTMLATFGLPFDLVGISSSHIETALKLAEKIPSLKMVFDHLNQPPIATKEKFGMWGSLMKEASSNSNFYAKISGLGTASGNFSGWPNDELKPYIAYALAQFGTDRCFCGGDWPVALLAGSYSRTWGAYRAILSDLLDDVDQEKVFSGNAGRFYHL